MRHQVTPRARRSHRTDWDMVTEVALGIAFIAVGVVVALGTFRDVGWATAGAGLLVCVGYLVTAREGSGS